MCHRVVIISHTGAKFHAHHWNMLATGIGRAQMRMACGIHNYGIVATVQTATNRGLAPCRRCWDYLPSDIAELSPE